MADDLEYPCYLDAGKEAKHLYETHGYIENTQVAPVEPLAAMVRPKKTDRDGR